MKHTLLSSIFFALVACNSNKSELPKIYLNQRTSYEVNGEVTSKDSLFNYPSSEYVELTLSSIRNGEFYFAGRDVRRPEVGRPFYSESLQVVDSVGKAISFKSSTEFLNFMAKRGYELADQKEARYHTDYTFRKIKD